MISKNPDDDDVVKDPDQPAAVRMLNEVTRYMASLDAFNRNLSLEGTTVLPRITNSRGGALVPAERGTLQTKSDSAPGQSKVAT